MRTSFIAIIIGCCLCNISNAQTQEITHTIQQGETLSALAKKYKTSVGDIMRLNGMNSKSILKLGAVLKIPTTSNVASNTPAAPTPQVANSQPATKPAVATPPPTTSTTTAPSTATNGLQTHTVAAKEGLYSIAKKYKITVAQLQEWNGLTGNDIKIGQVLNVAKPSTIVAKPVEQAPTATPTAPKPTVRKDTLPDIKIKAVNNIQSTPVAAANSLPATTTDVPKTVEQVSTEPVKPAVNQQAVPPVPSFKETEPIEGTKKWVKSEGFFANYFDRKKMDNAPAVGECSIFKSVSGWSDKKFYILINNIEPGTIVRLTVNNKSICAKVLNALPEMKDDNGLLCRINSAAASFLGLEEVNRFPISLVY